MDDGWHDPAVAQKQLALATGEYERWTKGAMHHPAFDAFQMLVGAVKPTTLLDVGCGAGYYSLLARDLGVPHYHGVDASEAMVAAARSAFPLVTFAVEDQCSLSARDGAYELVVSGCCLICEPLEQGWREALLEARRVASGAVLLHRVPVTPGPTRLEPNSFYGPTMTERFVNADAWAAMLAECGLRRQQTVRWREHLDPYYESVLCTKV